MKKALPLENLSFLTFLPWLALLGWLSSVAWFLCDDAFISFRYTRNLLEGHGLVFNPGEYVEGYTNFLWILELAAIWGIFGLRPEHAAPWLSVAYTIATIAAMLWWVARLPSLKRRGLVGWMALGLLCSSATFAVWTSGGGLETRQFTFFIVAAVVCLSLYANSRAGLLTASFSLAAAELTRPEGLLLAACCFAWFAVQRVVAEGRVNARLVRQIVYLVAPFALLVAAHFLFRYAYYGEWLPNTYYAKHIGPWYESGFRYLWAAALDTGLYLLLPLAYLALRTRWRMARDGTYALALLCVVAHMAYLLSIGGDFFEYRPLDFYWPLLALPAAEGIALLGSRISTGLEKFIKNSRRTARNETYAILLFLPLLFYANGIQGTLLFEEAANPAHTTAGYVKLNRNNAGWLLAAPGMPALVTISNDLRRLSTPQKVGASAIAHRRYFNSTSLLWQPYEKMDPGIIPDDALIAYTALGRLYFLPSLRALDIYGLTDWTVARTPVTHSNLEREMAHDRRPTHEYIKERGVNFAIYPPTASADAALDYADYAVKVGPDLWMPFNTLNAQWATSRFAGRDLRARNAFSTSEPAGNRFLVGDDTYVGKQILAHFENGFDGWELEGEAITNYSQQDDYAGEPFIWGRADSGFLTTYHPNKGNQTTGSARSPVFTAEADQFLAFLIAGGNRERVGLRLLANGKEVAVWRGSELYNLADSLDVKRFQLILHPLGYVAGKSLQLELFDGELGEWGHIMLDHVLLVACDKCPNNEPSLLAMALNQQPPKDDTVYLVPALEEHLNFRYLPREKAPIQIGPVDAPDLPKEVETALWKARHATVVKVVAWKTVNSWIDDNIEPLAFLLTKYGRLLGSDDYDHFTVYNYMDISFDRPWTFYEQLEPLTVNYDGGIALQGLALGLGAEQLPSGQLLNLGPERLLWTVLQWQIEPGLDVDYATSLRLYNAKDEVVFQHDVALWDPNHRPTSHWTADAAVDTLHPLHFPPALPPGEYELRLVVYNFDTQAPTVQIDVWKPEITLARLRIRQ